VALRASVLLQAAVEKRVRERALAMEFERERRLRGEKRVRERTHSRFRLL